MVEVAFRHRIKCRNRLRMRRCRALSLAIDCNNRRKQQSLSVVSKAVTVRLGVMTTRPATMTGLLMKAVYGLRI